MIISTEKVKNFLSEASVVKPNVLYPNLSDSIKIEYKDNDITFVKTNNNIFCIYAFEDTGFHLEDECYIVSERMLNGIAQTTESDFITITQGDGKLHIKGTAAEAVQCPVQKINEFPAVPQANSELCELSSEALYCAKAAGHYISQEQRITAASFVHIGPQGVFATNNNNIIYYRRFEGLPDIFISADALPVIKPLNGVTYCTHGNYDFINYQEGYSYGFIKSVVDKPINYLPMLGLPKQVNFTITKKQLLDFCTMVDCSAKTEYPTAKLIFDGTSLALRHSDANFNIDVHKSYAITGTECDDFNFSVNWLELFIKNLPYDNITFMREGHHFKLTSPDDECFIGMFAAIQ